MTKKEFFAAFKEASKNIVRSDSVRHIRFIENNFVYCPITLVHHKITNKQYNTYQWKQAAKELKLGRTIASKIVKGADYKYKDYFCSDDYRKQLEDCLE